jgi:hypothetical protein
MTQDKDDRKRPHLRLVVDNAEKRNARSEDQTIPLDELITRKEQLRPQFYHGLERWQAKACETLERFLSGRKLPYGLDPHHGGLMVLPAEAVCPEAAGNAGDPRDEILIYIAEDAGDRGYCLSLEMVLPFYSDDEAVMEDALLFSPLYQYGSLFLEENRQDELLDLIYRLGIPIYPPALTTRLMDRFFGIAALEIRETLRNLAEYPGE